MSIDANITQQQIVGKYLDNLGYDHNNSVTQCRLFIQACRALIVMHPSTWSASQQTITFDPRAWQQQLSEAQAWLNANTQSAGSVRHLAFGDFR